MSESNQTDQRVIYARDFLAGARKRRVSELPPSVLVREDAELRRLLGQVLDYLSEVVALGPHQVEVIGNALSDAIAWRTELDYCGACAQSPNGMCADHAVWRGRRDTYVRLGSELGIEVEQ